MPDTITKILFRRGTNVQRISATTAGVGVVFNTAEPAYTVDTKRLFVGDGVTQGGTPVGILNYGIVSALSGSYLNSGLTQTAYKLLSASLIGDIVYDQSTTSVWTVSSTSTVPNLSNFVQYLHQINYNSAQFAYNNNLLSILNGPSNGQYGVGVNELNTSVVAGSNALSGGSGVPLAIKTKSITNSLLTPAATINSIKATNGSGVVADLQILQGQLLGYAPAGGASLGGVYLSAGANLSLSANSNTFQFNFVNPGFVPLSGGTLTGVLTSTTYIRASASPIHPYDLTNKSYVDNLSSTYLNPLSNYLPLSGYRTITGPITSLVSSDVPVIRIVQGGTGYAFRVDDYSGPGGENTPFIIDSDGHVSISGFPLPGIEFSLFGSASASGALSASNVIVPNAPVNAFDVVNKAYIDSKFLPLSGGTMTGGINTSIYAISATNDPTSPKELTNKNYVDTKFADHAFVNTNFLHITGGTMQGGINSSTYAISATNDPTSSKELANKNYVDTKAGAATNNGSGIGIYKEALIDGGLKTLHFKSLSAGSGISIIDGTDVISLSSPAAIFNPVYTSLAGDGTTTRFNLNGGTSTNAAAYRVTLDGVVQEPTVDYSVAPNGVVGQITFTKAPYAGATIVVISYITTNALGQLVVPTSNLIAYDSPTIDLSFNTSTLALSADSKLNVASTNSLTLGYNTQTAKLTGSVNLHVQSTPTIALAYNQNTGVLFANYIPQDPPAAPAWWLGKTDNLLYSETGGTYSPGSYSVTNRVSQAITNNSTFTSYLQSVVATNRAKPTMPYAISVVRAGLGFVSKGEGVIALGDGNIYSFGGYIYDPRTGTYSDAIAVGDSGGGCLLADGRVFIVPTNASSAAWTINPRTGTKTTCGGTAAHWAKAFYNCALLPDGRVYLNPQATAVKATIYDPVTNTTTESNNTPTGISRTCVGLRDGRIYRIPGGTPANGTIAAVAYIYDPTTNNFSAAGGVVPTCTNNNYGWFSGRLLADGRVICAPNNADSHGALIYDPVADTLTKTGVLNWHNAVPGDVLNYSGGTLLPNGNIFFSPWCATYGIIYNPFDNTTQIIETLKTANSDAYGGCALCEDGSVYLSGYNYTDKILRFQFTQNFDNNTLTSPFFQHGSY